MSVHDVIQKYQQLSPEDKKQVDDLLQRLTSQIAPDDGEQKISLFGIWKGQIEMAPDFDEPLEDFKEYM